MTNQLIASGLSNYLSNPVKGKVVSCKSVDCLVAGQRQFNHQDPILNHYELSPMTNWCLVMGESYSSVEVQPMYSTAPVNTESKRLVIIMMYYAIFNANL